MSTVAGQSNLHSRRVCRRAKRGNSCWQKSQRQWKAQSSLSGWPSSGRTALVGGSAAGAEAGTSSELNRGLESGRHCEERSGTLTSPISHVFLRAPLAVPFLAGGVQASPTRGLLVSRTRPAPGLPPANRRAVGTIEMATITLAADAQLATTTPAIEEPERPPHTRQHRPQAGLDSAVRRPRCGLETHSQAFSSLVFGAQDTEDL